MTKEDKDVMIEKDPKADKSSVSSEKEVGSVKQEKDTLEDLGVGGKEATVSSSGQLVEKLEKEEEEDMEKAEKDKMEKEETVEMEVEGENTLTMGEKGNFKEEKITTVREASVEGKIKQKAEPSKGEIGAEEKTETLTDEKDTRRQFGTSSDTVADSKENNADAEKGADAASQEHKEVGSSGIDTSSEKDGSHKKDEGCSPNDDEDTNRNKVETPTKPEEDCLPNDDVNTNKNKVETPAKPEDVCCEKVEEDQSKSDGGREKLLILEPIWMKR